MFRSRAAAIYATVSVPFQEETMKNKRTTIAGYLLLAGAVLTAGAQFMSGGTPDFSALLAALAGVGFITAADGGH